MKTILLILATIGVTLGQNNPINLYVCSRTVGPTDSLFTTLSNCPFTNYAYPFLFGQCYGSPKCGTAPLYEFEFSYNSYNYHYYTTNWNDYGSFSSGTVRTFLGIPCYLYLNTAVCDGTGPVFQFRNIPNHAYILTTGNPPAGPANYTFDYVSWYMLPPS